MNNSYIHDQNCLNFNNGRAFVTNSNNKPEMVQHTPGLQQTMSTLGNVTKYDNDHINNESRIIKNTQVYNQAQQQSKKSFKKIHFS